MFNLSDPDLIHTVVNWAIIAFGALAIIFVLRGVFKVAWRVIKLILILLGLLVIVGQVLGYIHISFL